MTTVTRIRDERGMTLVEMLVAMVIGNVIMLAAFSLTDASQTASTRIQDRVDAVQRGRTAMEQITQRLRSQTCLGTGLPAMIAADDNTVTFYAELGDETFQPEIRRITFLSNGSIREEVWTSQTSATPLGFTFPGYPASPVRTRIVTSGIVHTNSGGVDVPYFRYYAFVGTDPATPALLLTTPLVQSDAARTVRIVVTYDSRPARTVQDRAVDTTFANDVYVRTADPTDPTRSPQCL